jgi:HAD superfamily hydrolase (TIGR01549 family)
MRWLKEIKLICWDLDGTLYPSNDKLKKKIELLIYQAVAGAQKINNTDAQELFLKKRSELKSSTKTLELLGVPGSDFFVSTWDNIDLSEYIDKNIELADKFAKASEFLVKHAILSNSNTQDQVVRKLKLIGINPSVFIFVLTSVDLGINKPDKKAFEAVINESGLSSEEILMVGDRVEVDLVPAKNVGMRTCLVGGKSSEADISVGTAEDVFDLFER